jgi:hypothetical protein
MDVVRDINKNNYIIIDCNPFSNRPDVILINILNNTKINIDDFVITNKFFGAWTFKLYKDKNEEYEYELNNIIKKLENCYKCGMIRYAEYSPKL